MALSNTAVPKYYGEFREKVIRGEIPVNEKISLQMNRIDRLIEHSVAAMMDAYVAYKANYDMFF